MIISHEGYLGIGSYGIEEHVYVELDNDDYIDTIGSKVDTEAIANKAMSNVISSEINGLFDKLIKDSLKVYADDSYDYDTIEDMASSRKMSTIEYCKMHEYLLLKDDIVYCEFNGKKYKVLIIIYVS